MICSHVLFLAFLGKETVKYRVISWTKGEEFDSVMLQDFSNRGICCYRSLHSENAKSVEDDYAVVDE